MPFLSSIGSFLRPKSRVFLPTYDVGDVEILTPDGNYNAKAFDALTHGLIEKTNLNVFFYAWVVNAFRKDQLPHIYPYEAASERDFASLVRFSAKYRSVMVATKIEEYNADVEGCMVTAFVNLQRQGGIKITDLTAKAGEAEYDFSHAYMQLFYNNRMLEFVRQCGSEVFKNVFNSAKASRENDLRIFFEELSTGRNRVMQELKKAYFSSVNKYGDRDLEDFNKEIDDFVEYLTAGQGFETAGSRLSVFPDVVDKLVNSITEDSGVYEDFPEDGHQFEAWVAQKLTALGWDAEVTVGSGDQGVDVIARKFGKTVAIQCKRFSGSVGNGAVQEAISGRTYYAADKAIVVTTGKYTRSAIELSKVADVLLLSNYDLKNIDEYFMDG